MTERDSSENRADGAAPFFGTWRRAYVAVIVAFVVQVALLWTLTRVFS